MLCDERILEQPHPADAVNRCETFDQSARVTVLVDQPRERTNECSARVIAEPRRLGRQPPGVRYIVVIETRDVLAGRVSQTNVQGPRQPEILRVANAPDPRIVDAGDNRGGVVRRGIVNDDEFEIWQGFG